MPRDAARVQFRLFQHPVDGAQKHDQVAFIQLGHTLNCFLDQLRVLGAVVKKLLGRDLKVVADGKNSRSGGRALPEEML